MLVVLGSVAYVRIQNLALTMKGMVTMTMSRLMR
jgi:hypothetical protein